MKNEKNSLEDFVERKPLISEEWYIYDILKWNKVLYVKPYVDDDEESDTSTVVEVFSLFEKFKK